MSLLFFSCSVFTAPSPYSSSMAMTMATTTASPTPISRLQMVSISLHQVSCNRFSVITNKRGALSVKASAWDLDGGESQSESEDEEDLPFDQLPLDSKLQLKLEQKMRMKLSKKIRLRRKKLVHKRRMRKRGRWPPSKMKTLKNV